MRGIDGALSVMNDVERGMFASESLRRVLRDIEPAERKLASSLVYVTLRRMGLWKHLLAKFCKRPVASLNRETALCLVVGIAGVLELEHFKPGVLVNALAQRVKTASREDSREAPLVNAVLHTVMEKAPSYIENIKSSRALRDQALAFGVPGWVAADWGREFGVKEARRLIRLSASRTWMSLRASDPADSDALISECAAFGAAKSDTAECGIRLEANPYPPDVPGYAEGRLTPQTESSMAAVETFLSLWNGGRVLDMCVGRGVKAGHILTRRPEAELDGWDLSAARLRAAEREFARLGVKGRYSTVCGDAGSIEPETRPDAIVLDAPCSGSGTWGRHPDGKWRAAPAGVEKLTRLQKKLLARGCEILRPGGIIMYCTCSVFREENENVAGSVMASRNDLVELPAKGVPSPRKGKPYGTAIWPETPWLDGFYIVIFKKKGRAEF
ncbi:MAG: RsmB/NOP family class I SAM-dependent RNA methyltransferase [Synergistaceae bacterium]|jgi:16S rRNA (cytosine967-C5)-methyltransferase|nr:RsmB/NOP family class I SAM-dependent RNA methyltransferase [Synergistaceae bacterium]